ncbi:MFS transporter [Nocardia sp. NPDC049220]|uniref:MFS transporter n=1 Tax=Nocardia sp. NPDC049220 TaxID=3155273 RepID=UPI0034057AB8
MSILTNNKNFLLLWSGNATSFVGYNGVRIAYPLLALSLTGSPVVASWVGFAITLPCLIFQVPAGVAADYGNRMRTLVKCKQFGLAATLLTATVVVLQPPGVSLFLMSAALVEGTAQVFFATTELGLVRDIVSVQERREAFSLIEAEESIATVVGRALGAVALGAGRSLPFLANAATYLYCLWSLSIIKGRVPAQPDVDSLSIWDWNRAWAGMRIVWTEPYLRSTSSILAATNFIFEVVVLLIALDISDSGRPVWEVGLVLGASGLGGMLSTVPTVWLSSRVSARTAFVTTLWAWAVLLALIAVSSSPVVYAVALMGIAGFGTFSNVVLTMYQVRVIPEAMMGRVVGAMLLVQCSGMAVGALLAGYILSMLGISTTGWLLVVAMVILAWRARRIKEPAAVVQRTT